MERMMLVIMISLILQ